MNDPARCAEPFTQSETRWSAPLPRTLPNPSLISVLASSFASGPVEIEQVAARGAETLGRPWRWLRPVARRYVKVFARETRPRHDEVMRFLLADPGFQAACVRHAAKLKIAKWFHQEDGMQPVAAALSWGLPSIVSVAQLASWLHVDAGELMWFADLRGLERKGELKEELRHYRYRIVPKSNGGLRLIEAPKRRLKTIQRTIFEQVLCHVPIHESVHGFVKGRSIQTFAAPHVGKDMVLRMDLLDFFPSVIGVRVQSLFRLMGYPETVADLLGGLCTNATPRHVWKGNVLGVDAASIRQARALYAAPHLPQGAPSSPALANLCAHRMDCRLHGLAHASGATYTRYADDLAFSGGVELLRGAERFITFAAAIAQEEGFSVNHRKTRVMRRAVRQHLAGLVINDKMNLRRDEYDKIKALLTNCVRDGPAVHNRGNHPFFRAHVEGKVNFVASVHPARGKKLLDLLEKVDWSGWKDRPTMS